MNTPAIEAHGLRKSYGGNIVLDDVDLSVSAGTVTALLGPNGAGKTTIVRILTTLIDPDAGDVRVGPRGVDGLAPGPVLPREKALGEPVVRQDREGGKNSCFE